MATTQQIQGTNIRIVLESESAVRNGPARVRIYEGDTLIAEIVGTITREQGADGGIYPVVTLTDAADLPPWKWVVHHDDPPCKARLRKDGYCAK